MISHTTEAMDSVAESFHRFLQKKVEPEAIVILEEYRLAGITAKDYMIDGAGIMNAWFAWHA